MKRTLKIKIFLVSFVLLGLCFRHVHAEVLNRVVAVVNDDIITLYELNNKIKSMTGQTPNELRLKDEKAFMEARHKILELLIDEKLAQDKIRELGIQVSQKEVDEAIEKIKIDNRWTQEDLEARLKQEGISMAKYKEQMKEELERIQLVNLEVRSKIIIREETLNEYYQEHKEKFSENGQVQLGNIFLMRKDPGNDDETLELTKKGNEILKRILAGEDFGVLAKKYSEGPGARDGGNLGVFKLSELDPQLRKLISALPEGGVSNLIIRPNGIQIIKVIKKQGGKEKSFEEMKDAIYTILYKEEINKRYDSWMKDLRESAYTKITF